MAYSKPIGSKVKWAEWIRAQCDQVRSRFHSAAGEQAAGTRTSRWHVAWTQTRAEFSHL